MIHILFGKKTTRSGGRGPGYLTDDLRPNPVEVIRGIPEETLEVVNVCAKHLAEKYTSIVLSCEELLDRKTIDRIIDDYESMAYVGINTNHISKYWVLHEDHGRTELHCIIANVYLPTGVSWKHFYYKSDERLFDTWQELANLKYDLSSPQAPEKARIESMPPKNISKEHREAYEAMDKKVCDALLAGEVQTQKDIIELLKDPKYEITGTKKYVGFRPAGSKMRKIRLSGFKYCQDFNALRDLASQFFDKATAFNAPNRRSKLERDLEVGLLLRKRRNFDRYAKYIINTKERNDYGRGKNENTASQALAPDGEQNQRAGTGELQSDRDYRKTINPSFERVLRFIVKRVTKIKRSLLNHSLRQKQKALFLASQLNYGRIRFARWNRLNKLRGKQRSYSSETNMSSKTRLPAELHQPSIDRGHSDASSPTLEN